VPIPWPNTKAIVRLKWNADTPRLGGRPPSKAHRGSGHPIAIRKVPIPQKNQFEGDKEKVFSFAETSVPPGVIKLCEVLRVAMKRKLSFGDIDGRPATYTRA